MIGKVRNLSDAKYASERRLSELLVPIIAVFLGFAILCFCGAILLFVFMIFENDWSEIPFFLMMSMSCVFFLIIPCISYYFYCAKPLLVLFDDGYFSGIMSPSELIGKSVPVMDYSGIREVRVGDIRTVGHHGMNKGLILQTVEGRTIILDDEPDLFDAVMVLNEHIPKAIKNSAKEYIPHAKEFKGHPTNMGGLLWGFLEMGFWYLLSWVLMIVLFIPFLTILLRNELITSLALLITALFLALTLFVLLFSFYHRRLTMTFLWSASPQKGRVLKLTRLPFAWVCLHPKTEIKAEEIRAIKRALIPKYLQDCSRVQLNDGRWYTSHFEMWRWATEELGFKVKGNTAYNPAPNARAVREVFILSLPKMVFLFTLYFVSLGCLYALAVFNNTIAVIIVTGIGSIGSMFLFSSILLLIPVVVYNWLPWNRTAFDVGSDKIVVSDRWGHPQTIEFKDIIEIRKGKYYGLTCTEIVAKTGLFRMPPESFHTINYHLAKVKEPKKAVVMGAPVTERKVKAPPTPTKGKGKLWLVEDEDGFRKRRRKEVLAGWAMVLMLNLLGFFAFFLLTIKVSIQFIVLASVIAGIILIISIILGILLTIKAFRLEPIKIYENGVELHLTMDNKTRFFPYGDYISIDKWNESYALKGNRPGVQIIFVPKDIPGLDSRMKDIKARINNPKYSGLSIDQETVAEERAGPAPSGRGKVLFTEDDKYYLIRKKNGIMASLIIAGIGLILTPISIILGFVIHNMTFWMVVAVAVIVFQVFLWVGVYHLVQSFKIKRTIFYEGGVEYSDPRTMTAYYHPYGLYLELTAGSDTFGEYYLLQPKPGMGANAVIFYKDNIGGKENVGKLKARINNPDYMQISST